MKSDCIGLDLLVICPLREEYCAFQKTLKELRINCSPLRNDLTEFCIQTHSGPLLTCKVAFLPPNQRSGSGAVISALALVREHRPNFVAVIGIAMTGIDNDSKVGLVALADSIVEITDVKGDSAQTEQLNNYYNQFSKSLSGLLGDPAFSAEHFSFAKMLRDQFEIFLPDHPKIYPTGPIITGLELVSDRNARRRIERRVSSHRKAVAYDMESSYIVNAMRAAEGHTRIFVIRGLSDKGIQKRSLEARTKGNLRSYVTMLASHLLISGLQWDALYNSFPRGPKRLSRAEIPVLCANRNAASVNALRDALQASGLLVDIIDRSESVMELISRIERARAVVVLADMDFLRSELSGLLSKARREMRERFADLTSLVILQCPSVPCIDMTDCLRGGTKIPFDPNSAQEASDSVARFIRDASREEAAHPEQTSFGDDLQVNDSRTEIRLRVDKAIRRFGWNLPSDILNHEIEQRLCALSSDRRRSIVNTIERLYRVFRDVHQCVLHAELNLLRSINSGGQALHEHLRHASGIMKTRGILAIREFRNLYMGKKALVPAANIDPLHTIWNMHHFYDRSYELLQALLGAQTVEEGKLNTLCAIVDRSCHWLLRFQGEVTAKTKL